MKTTLGIILFLIVPLALRGEQLRYRPFLRGDVDESRDVGLTDAVKIFGFLFLGIPRSLPCEDVADANDSGSLEITDGVLLLNYLFLGGPPPKAPHLVPGHDPSTDDAFSCGDVFFAGGSRPVLVHVPPNYDPAEAAPLILGLHSYAENGVDLSDFVDFRTLARDNGYLYALPNGTEDALNLPFWNATDSCCNFFESPIDDAGYLRGVIEEIRSVFRIDARRIFVLGHSNGGFMAHRMACDHADLLAGIISISGATFMSPDDCLPSAPVHILEIHGTEDDIIPYEGGTPLDLDVPRFPGAGATAELWAAQNGCDTSPFEDETLDLTFDLEGHDTLVTRYETGCLQGATSELWTVEGGGHSPHWAPGFYTAVTRWLETHTKP